MSSSSGPRFTTILAAICIAAAMPLAAPAFAQSGCPNKPIKIIAPVQPGGGGVVGSMATARAAPDGYTLMVGYVGPQGTNPAVRKLPYDAIKDFTSIVEIND